MFIACCEVKNKTFSKRLLKHAASKGINSIILAASNTLLLLNPKCMDISPHCWYVHKTTSFCV